MRAIVLTLVALLGACNTPSARFLGAEGRTAEVDGLAFVVYLTATEAEVIRIGSDLRWSSEMMAGRAVEALAQVSDCTFRAGTLRAQPTVVRGRIACPGPSPAPSA